MLKNIRKHLKIHRLFIKYSLLSQMEYRFNFFMGIVMDVIFFFTKVVYALIVYNTNSTVYGLSPDAVLLVVGTFSIVTSIYVSFFMVNFNQLQNNVNNGKLDTYITKPVSTQFMTTTNYVEVSSILPDLTGGIILTCVAWSRLGLPLNFMTLLIYVTFILAGIIVAYSIFFIIQLLSFFIIKTSSITQISDTLWDFNNIPMVAYSKWIQKVGLFVLPIFLISNFPVMLVLEQIENVYMIWGILVPCLLLVLTRALWRKAIKRYSSASS